MSRFENMSDILFIIFVAISGIILNIPMAQPGNINDATENTSAHESKNEDMGIINRLENNDAIDTYPK